MEDKFSKFFRRFYILIFFGVFFCYSAFSIVAPVLMHFQFELPARLIYGGYRFMCHQLPYRSFFLYGEQSYYPLQETNRNAGVISFEEASRLKSADFKEIRNFIGNEQMGYKIAICQRDLAIYLSIAFFCLIYFLSNYRLPRIHWLFWLIFGLFPMFWDGLSQMISRFMPALVQLRESTPILRVITGSSFGFFTAWFLFPYLEHVFRDQETS
mgnify:CR=1 FL=1